MRLLFVIPNIVSYRSFLSGLGAQLIADGDEIHIACYSDALWGNDPAAPEPEDVHLHRIEFPRGMNPLQHFAASRRLRRLVRSIRPDLIHAHFSAAIFTTALAHAGDWPRTIATFHGLSFPARRGFGGTPIRLAETFAARRFDEVCVLTEDDASALRRTVPGVRVEMLSSCGLGCDLEKFAPVSAPVREARRAELGFRPEQCVFVFVGRFVAFKGFDCAVRAFLRLAGDHPHVRLHLVGSRDPIHPTGLSEAEEQALRACPQVVDTGFQKDVHRHLAAADVMVFPSSREGMPVCLMEALAMGIPAITRDSRGCREVVRDGIDGFVLRECGPDQVRAVMQRLADDLPLREQFAAQARAGRGRFSRAHFIAAQKAIYAAPAADAGDRESQTARVPLRKRLLDLALAGPAFLLLLPVMGLVAVLVAWRLGSPVMFRQRRPGLKGRPFTVAKFRTMTDARDASGKLKSDLERLTPLGRFLRKTSLDEVPQLWNVVCGQMSLVGPRPLLMEYLPNYTPEQQRRHEVLPGITGWAQINGRNALLFRKRLELDVWYVDHWSFALDVRILWLTVARVMQSSGVKLEQTLEEMDDIGLHPETRRKAGLEPGQQKGAPDHKALEMLL